MHVADIAEKNIKNNPHHINKYMNLFYESSPIPIASDRSIWLCSPPARERMAGWAADWCFLTELHHLNGVNRGGPENKMKKQIIFLSDVSARLTGLHVTKEGEKNGEAGSKGGEKKKRRPWQSVKQESSQFYSKSITARTSQLSITLFHTNYYPHWAGDRLVCRRARLPVIPKMTDWEGSLAVICDKVSGRGLLYLETWERFAFMLMATLLTLIWCMGFSPRRQYYSQPA